MNDELQKALQRVLEGLITTAEKAADFGAEQLPLVVQEYLAWGFWSASLTLITIGAVLILSLILFRRGFPVIHDDQYWAMFNRTRYCEQHSCYTSVESPARSNPKKAGVVKLFQLGIGGVVAIMSTIAFLTAGLDAARTMIQISVAPRVYLIDQLREMLK